MESLLLVIIQDDDADALSADLGAVQASRTAMESAMAGPSAAHPVEGYGSANLSLAKVQTRASALIRMISLVAIAGLTLHQVSGHDSLSLAKV